MKRLSLVLLLSVWLTINPAPGQDASPAPASPAAKKQDKEEKNDQDSPLNKFFGGGSDAGEPVKTEIYADEAFFDSSKSMGRFSGHVKVVDPRFNLQADKLTVFIAKGENQGLERAIAEGNVGVVRDRPDPNGGAPTRAVGRADNATYTASTGNVELKGTPRVQQGENIHVATSPDTVMILNQNGQLSTRGPSRTDIRQQPKTEDKEGAAGEKKKGENKGKADAARLQSSPTP